jgi:hypothetical protein
MDYLKSCHVPTVGDALFDFPPLSCNYSNCLPRPRGRPRDRNAHSDPSLFSYACRLFRITPPLLPNASSRLFLPILTVLPGSPWPPFRLLVFYPSLLKWISKPPPCGSLLSAVNTFARPAQAHLAGFDAQSSPGGGGEPFTPVEHLFPAIGNSPERQMPRRSPLPWWELFPRL